MLFNSNNIIRLKTKENVLTRICELSQTFNAHIFLSRSLYDRLKCQSLIQREGQLLKVYSSPVSAILQISLIDNCVSIDTIIKEGYNSLYFKAESGQMSILLV